MKSVLINNSTSGGRFEKFVCNLLPSPCRLDILEGKEYVVVPMVILTEGVHNGSEGPFYYPKEELSKVPVVWNHKPVVVYHPTMNGVGISACDPTVINSRKVGVMMNTRFEKGKLKSEAWIDKDRANAVDARIMEAVEKKEMMELSTGVFIDNDMTPGEWNGERYVGVARNYRPDHLALLPDQIGACSIADGAGFLRNQESRTPEFRSALRSMLEKAGLIRNEMSFSKIREALQTAIREKLEDEDEGEEEGEENEVENSSPMSMPWVEDVYSNFVIYEQEGKLFRIGYTSSDTGVTLAKEGPVEVYRVTEYRTVAKGTFVGNQTQPKLKGIGMNKKELVDAIVGNAKSAWKESDRDALMAFTEDQLKAIQNSLNPPAQTPPPPAQATPPASTPPVANQDKKEDATPKPVTVQEYIQNAPKEIQEVLHNGLATYNEQKTKVIEVILANKNNIFTKEDLEGRSLRDLNAIARLATVEAPARPTANYAGMAPVPAAGGVEEPLVAPTLNFSK